MNTPTSRLIWSLLGSALMAYIFMKMPETFYEPARFPNMSGTIWLIHLIFLYIHEGGHALFRPFGETIYMLGGSIMQVLAPLIWIGTASHDHSRLVIPAVFFTGYSMVDVSVYMKDAELKILPLIGGHKTRHDWAWVLTKYDAINLGQPLGEVFFWIGMAMAFGAIVSAVYLSIRSYTEAI